MAFLADGLANIARRHHVDSIYVFGSRASEVAARLRDQNVTREHPNLDVDIAV